MFIGLLILSIAVFVYLMYVLVKILSVELSKLVNK